MFKNSETQVLGDDSSDDLDNDNNVSAHFDDL